jgi:uncharacterized protein (DUF427 family)
MTEPVIENVQSYPRPPLLEAVTARLRLVVDGDVIADTDKAFRVCETHHPPTYYFPPDSLAPGVAVPASGRSLCEWKGSAAYFDLIGRDGPLRRAAWSYLSPTDGFRPISGYLAFYLSDRVKGYVGTVPAQSQPGGFYGGWVTPNLTGRIKGMPGTEGW